LLAFSVSPAGAQSKAKKKARPVRVVGEYALRLIRDEA
jgi:hypothetical protein